MTGNAFAYMALLGWPLLSFIFYSRFTTLTATFLTIVGGYMLLPVKVEIDLPLVPPLDKTSIPAVSAMLWCLVVKKKWVPIVPDMLWEKFLFCSIFILLILTAATNSEPVFNGEQLIQGLRIYDGISYAMNFYIELIPFLLGMAIVKDKGDLYKLVRLMVIAGVLYTPAILFEIRMSPQLHNWVYGFFPHSFLQQVRFDGFRPVVFIGHGLTVAILMVIVCAMTATLAKMRLSIAKIPATLILLYMIVVLLLCKSVGAWIIGAIAIAFILLLPASTKQKTAFVVALLIACYPLFSLFGWFPFEELLEAASVFGEDRVQSLAFRFNHEGALLNHALEKMWLGWGGWSRNRLADSVTDGYWIILLGTAGMLGYLGVTGLLLSSIYRAGQTIHSSKDQQERRLLSSLSLLIALIMLDQIPNGSLTSVVWFFCGAMIYRVKVDRKISLSPAKLEGQNRVVAV